MTFRITYVGIDKRGAVNIRFQNESSTEVIQCVPAMHLLYELCEARNLCNDAVMLDLNRLYGEEFTEEEIESL